MVNVVAFADEVLKTETSLDVLINNAGVYATPAPRTVDGLDIRFAVNTLAPLALTQRLSPLLGSGGRVINLSSAAQAPVNIAALQGEGELDDHSAYAQSKLALTAWTHALGQPSQRQGPALIAVNPGSLLASKMVNEAFGVAGADLNIGAQILCRAAFGDDFADAAGKYFDNDSGHFAPPHPDALDANKNAQIVTTLEALLTQAVR